MRGQTENHQKRPERCGMNNEILTLVLQWRFDVGIEATEGMNGGVMLLTLSGDSFY